MSNFLFVLCYTGLLCVRDPIFEKIITGDMWSAQAILEKDFQIVTRDTGICFIHSDLFCFESGGSPVITPDPFQQKTSRLFLILIVNKVNRTVTDCSQLQSSLAIDLSCIPTNNGPELRSG